MQAVAITPFKNFSRPIKAQNGIIFFLFVNQSSDVYEHAKNPLWTIQETSIKILDPFQPRVLKRAKIFYSSLLIIGKPRWKNALEYIVQKQLDVTHTRDCYGNNLRFRVIVKLNSPYIYTLSEFYTRNHWQYNPQIHFEG